MTLGLVFLIVALILFVIAGLGIAYRNWNILGWGLAFFAASFLFGGHSIGL
jgi:hypothetical protein